MACRLFLKKRKKYGLQLVFSPKNGCGFNVSFPKVKKAGGLSSVLFRFRIFKAGQTLLSTKIPRTTQLTEIDDNDR